MYIQPLISILSASTIERPPNCKLSRERIKKNVDTNAINTHRTKKGKKISKKKSPQLLSSPTETTNQKKKKGSAASNK